MFKLKHFAAAALPVAVFAAFSYAAPAWQEGTTYSAGTTVSYSGHDYSALVTHTAYVGANWNPLATPTLWKDLGVSTGSVATPTPAATVAPTSIPFITPNPTVAPTTAPTVAPTVTPAAGACTAAAWSSTAIYTNQTVSYNGRNYQAKWWTQNNTPSATDINGPWRDLGACAAGPTATPVVTIKPTPTPIVTPLVTPTATPIGSIPTPKPTAIPVVTASPIPTVTPTTTPVGPTPTPSIGGKEVGSYFAQWGVYARGMELADMVSNGSAAKMTYLNYAFGNIYPKNGGYECGAGIDKLESGASTPKAADAGSGGDAWADYGRTPSRQIAGGTPITWETPLAGNFHELQSLRKMYPNMKIFISLGGWTWSKWFSSAAKTDALRKQLVASCLDIYINGNLPMYSGRGGVGAMANVFDGVDIDWEFPGGGGQPYNTVDANDKRNFTLLMAEFRAQLDALSKTNNNKKYYLTAAMSAGKDKIDNTEPAEYSKYLDFINLMTYDFHGGWEYTSTTFQDAAGENNANPAAKTDFHSNLYVDPKSPNYLDPKTGQRGVASYYNIDDSVKNLTAAGFPSNKIILGVPFYGRGWSGVPNVNNGLYQQATTPAHGTYENGIEDYKVLVNAPGTVYVDAVTKQSWKFDGSTFWSYDTPVVIQTKIDYVNAQNLGGMFSWSLDGDDKSATLMNAMSKVRK